MICCCNTNCLSKEYCDRFTEGLDKDDEDLVNFGKGKKIYGCEYLKVTEEHKRIEKQLKKRIKNKFIDSLEIEEDD